MQDGGRFYSWACNCKPSPGNLTSLYIAFLATEWNTRQQTCFVVTCKINMPLITCLFPPGCFCEPFRPHWPLWVAWDHWGPPLHAWQDYTHSWKGMFVVLQRLPPRMCCDCTVCPWLQMLLEVVSNYIREASNTVRIKMFKVKVGSLTNLWHGKVSGICRNLLMTLLVNSCEAKLNVQLSFIVNFCQGGTCCAIYVWLFKIL